MDDAMTSDRSPKKAARARMAATGESYSTARRAAQARPDRPAPLARPPAIDPREHAVHSRHWGVLAALGDAIRRHQPRADAGDSLRPLWHEAGLPQESLSRVLAGQDWAWPQQPVVRPPGSRLPDTPTTTLATHTVDGHRFDLVSYLDTAGGRCIAIDRDGRRGAAVCDIQVDERYLASAAMTMATRGHGTAAIYGRVHDSVTELYAVMKNGERVDWPIYDDPRNTERYFAVIADSEALADIVAAAPTGRTSLKQFFGIWFSQPPDPGPGRSRARRH
jgi:hypothetical protein